MTGGWQGYLNETKKAVSEPDIELVVKYSPSIDWGFLPKHQQRNKKGDEEKEEEEEEEWREEEEVVWRRKKRRKTKRGRKRGEKEGKVRRRRKSLHQKNSLAL